MNYFFQYNQKSCLLSTIFFLIFTVYLSAIDQPGKAGLVDLKYGTADLVPIISFDVSKAPYSADKTGAEDCTKAFNSALQDAKEKGGTVFVPVGKYKIEGELLIPSGVTLRGDWKQPTKTDLKVGGTILLAYSGRGDVNGKPFITAKEGGVRDLSIFYPEQKINDIAPYPKTIHLDGSAALKNVTLVNSYRGVLTGGFSTIMNLYGTTLDVGVTMLQAAAVPRCRTIRLSPRYWSESGLESSPQTKDVQKALYDRKAFAIQLNRQDAGIFMDVEVEHYHTAVKLMPPHGWTYWHNLQIKDVDVGIHFTGGSNQRMYITSSSVQARKYGVLMKMDQKGWGANWMKLSKSGKEYGTSKDIGLLRLFDCRIYSQGSGIFLDGSFRQQINLQECKFLNWGDNADDFAIKADLAEIDVFDSQFSKSKNHLRINNRRSALTFVGNQLNGSPSFIHPKLIESKIDHSPGPNNSPSMQAIRPVPDMLPAKLDKNSIFIVTDSPFNAPNDGLKDASAAIQSALNNAGDYGGGTVYLPQGSYRLTKHLTVPAGVELRGVNDFMPRGKQARTLLVADIPADKGNENNPPLITLQSSPTSGGSGVAGLAVWYPHQDYRDIKAYPWTIRSMGPGCWVQRVFLGNCYNAIDFATHNNDKHLISRVCGSALNRAFMVGNSPTIGWVDNCHIRPQDWALSSYVPKKPRNKKREADQGFVYKIPGDKYSKPTPKDIFRGTQYSLIPNLRGAGVITVGSGANVQVTAFFTNGSTRAFDFIDQQGTGGGNANILIGGSEAGWGAWIKKLGKKGLTMTNFSFNPMTRLPYIEPKHILPGHLPKGLAMRIDPTVSKDSPITFISTKFYGRNDVDLGIDMQGGKVFFKQGVVENEYKGAAIKVKGGIFKQRNTRIGKVVKVP